MHSLRASRPFTYIFSIGLSQPEFDSRNRPIRAQLHHYLSNPHARSPPNVPKMDAWVQVPLRQRFFRNIDLFQLLGNLLEDPAALVSKIRNSNTQEK